MLRTIFKSFTEKNKAIIFQEASLINGFLHLLFKPVNTGNPWTQAEKKILKSDIRHISLYVPVLIVFLLPGGSLLLPLLPKFLDRRKTRRPVSPQP